MGTGPSQEEYDTSACETYELILSSTCLLPDVGIDESLWKYSGINSNTELQTYSNELLNSVPGFVQKLGSALGALTTVPNAVGIGALVLSMIMEICITSTEISEDSYSMLRRVFGEEKASSVRDTMTEYLKRHRMFLNDDQQLLVEIRRLEQQLSKELTILRNSLLDDGQMSTRGFKIWVNGASFHVQMLIHQARLEIQAGKPESDSAYKVKVVLDVYLKDLDTLLDNYKTYKISITHISMIEQCFPYSTCYWSCEFKNTEAKCEVSRVSMNVPCLYESTEGYINYMFSKYEPIIGLRSHFSGVSANVDSLIIQNDTFTLPSQ